MVILTRTPYLKVKYLTRQEFISIFLDMTYAVKYKKEWIMTFNIKVKKYYYHDQCTMKNKNLLSKQHNILCSTLK